MTCKGDHQMGSDTMSCLVCLCALMHEQVKVEKSYNEGGYFQQHAY